MIGRLMHRRWASAIAAGAVASTAVVLGPVASGGVDDVVLASTSSTGKKGNDDSYQMSISADGRTVAFGSQARNFDPRDTDSHTDVYVKDLDSGEIALASTSDTGVKGDEYSAIVSLSADGRTVAFRSEATNFDPADHDTVPDIYVKDLITGDITLASTSDSGVKSNGDCYDVSLSADGRTVAFACKATNLDPADTDSYLDVYVKDLVTGELTLASTSDTGVKGRDLSEEPSLSADASSVSFTSRARNLDPADDHGGPDVYVKDLITGDITLASTSKTGVKGNRESSGGVLSADGQSVAFHSRAKNFDRADRDDIYDIYVKDLVTGKITVASTSDDGVKGRRDSFLGSVSADGQRVGFYSSSGNLVEGDDRKYDVFVKDLTTGNITQASVSDDGVDGNRKSYFGLVAADGSAVTFASESTNLDPGDIDRKWDVYVTRLGDLER